MGYAARRNVRSFSNTDAEARELALLRDHVALLPTREDFERWLLGFPAETRAEVRAMVQSAAPWTVENRRQARLERDEWQRHAKARARAIALGLKVTD